MIDLVLGTAQFGLNYGITGRNEPVPRNEVQHILKRAWELGIRIIDTAPAYGDIEEKLLECSQNAPFSFVSKIPAVPVHLSKQAIEDFICLSIVKTIKRLGSRLNTLLFHRSEDLLGAQGQLFWDTATSVIRDQSIQLGASCYSPQEMLALSAKYPISAVQLPGNPLDQRIMSVAPLPQIDIYLRSLFLQGMLLMEPYTLESSLPHASAAIQKWMAWCQQYGFKPLHAALSIANGLPGVRYCVVGVDSLSQLEEICEAWSNADVLFAPQLAIDDLEIIDPRRWNKQ